MQKTTDDENEIIVHAENVTPLERTDEENEPQEDKEDLEVVHENLKEIVEQGTTTLKSLFELANDAEHPRIYEVLATMINSVTKANRDFLDVSQKKNKTSESSEDPDKPKETHNHLYVGSTAELLEIIEKNKKENE